MPWQALAFLTLWLEQSCFDHASAAALVAAFGVGCTVGSLVGGAAGDAAARASRDHGRIAAAQFSSGGDYTVTACPEDGSPRPSVAR